LESKSQKPTDLLHVEHIVTKGFTKQKLIHLVEDRKSSIALVQKSLVSLELSTLPNSQLMIRGSK
jgi:hypothetical protein